MEHLIDPSRLYNQPSGPEYAFPWWQKSSALLTSLDSKSHHPHDPSHSHQLLLDSCLQLAAMMVPLWLSVVVGLVLGWSWKPRWVSLAVMAFRSTSTRVTHSMMAASTAGMASWSNSLPNASTLPLGLGTRRLWLTAVTLGAALPALRELSHGLMWRLKRLLRRYKLQAAATELQHREEEEELKEERLNDSNIVSIISGHNSPPLLVDVSDLEVLCAKLDGVDGGASWQPLMEKSASGMEYSAWRRDTAEGPTEYRSRTVIHDCSPETMRDFFWDDEFRVSSRWDDMLVESRVLEDCHETGLQVVQWVRKFPFFCKDREYVIARRIWSADNVYFCVTKGASHKEAPPRNNPKRVKTFQSSWRIRRVNDSSCEVLLFHLEDMGIQKDLAKMGIRQGMWPAVKKIEPGVRKYQSLRTEQPLAISRSASMANVHTPISPAVPSLTRIWHSLSDLTLQDSSLPLPTPSTMAGIEARRMQGEGGGISQTTSDGEQNSESIVHQHSGGSSRRLGSRWWIAVGLAAFACGFNPNLVCQVLLGGAARKKFKTHSRK